MLRRLSVSIPLALALSMAPAPGYLQEPPECPDGGTTLRWESFVAPLLEAACGECHEWDYAEVYRDRIPMIEQISSGNMPPFDPLPDDDAARLTEWLACDAPSDGPSCPPAGTSAPYAGVVREFLAVNCNGCHSRDLEGEARQGAPPGQDFDDPAALRAHAARLRASLLRENMPPADPAPQPAVDQVLEWLACGLPGLPDPPPFRRADANQDGVRDVSDAVGILSFLFSGTATITCPDAADTDASGILDITDAVYWLSFLFLGGPAPPEPFAECKSLEKLGCGSALDC